MANVKFVSMANLGSKLFARIIARSRDVYLLKIITLAAAFASSILIAVFCLNEFGCDRFHEGASGLFRVLQKNNDDTYNGNRLSAKIPSDAVHLLNERRGDSLLISRVKILNKVTVSFGTKSFRDQKVHAVDAAITDILTFDIIDGNKQPWREQELTCLISSRAAEHYTGNAEASGNYLKLYASGDTVRVRVGAVFREFPPNSHERFDLLLLYDSNIINTLGFDPNKSGVYGKLLKASPLDYSGGPLRGIALQPQIEYHLQPLIDIYFGRRVLDEDARHGDAYSITLLICIAALILFLAISSFMNLTTLSLPYRAKEIAVKKLAGMNEQNLLYSFARESLMLVGFSLAIALVILAICDVYTEPILDVHIMPLLLHGDPKILVVVATLVTLAAISPVFMVLRFIRATPNRLLSTDTITFPKFKRIIALLQLGISIFLIIASVVIRRQINYSLLKEPGRNHDQVVYLNCPSGITNEGIIALRSGWKKYNPNIIDVIAVSQLPDRISSKEVDSEFYTLKVDPGFLDFFRLQMNEGNWFRVNDGDSIIVTNKTGKKIMGGDTANVIGVIEDYGERFNQPSKPVKISLADNFNYNWLCVRVLEVDIRRTVARLSEQFSTENDKASVHYLNKRFEEWLNYQDRLNLLSGILALISALLSCCAIYGLSVSIVRDKMKQIAVHKLYGARVLHIVGLLLIEFAKQMLLAVIIFAPITYIFLNELLRTFVYATEFQWLDPVYPMAYCAVVITLLCVIQASSLTRADLTNVLKR